MARRSCVLVLALVLLATLFVSAMGATMHSGTRGFQHYGLDAEKHAEQHKPHIVLGKAQQNIHEHSDVKAFLDWRQKHQEGHPQAGAAFAGKLPHDFYKHIVKDDHGVPNKEDL